MRCQPGGMVDLGEDLDVVAAVVGKVAGTLAEELVEINERESRTIAALRDALLAVKARFVEVHLSNVHAREPFRRHSYFSDIAAGCIVGLGPKGYELALDAALDQIESTAGQRPLGG